MITTLAVTALAMLAVIVWILLSEDTYRKVPVLSEDQRIGLAILLSVYAKFEHLGAGRDLEYQNARILILMAMYRVRQG